MKHIALFLGLVLFSTTAMADYHWVVGQDYVVQFHDEQQALIHKLTPNSWALDKESCSVWVTDRANTLFKFAPQKAPIKSGKALRVLNDPINGEFFTVSPDGGWLQKRAEDGKIKIHYNRKWAQYSSRIATLGDKKWTLGRSYRPDQLWLSPLDEELNDGEHIPVADGHLFARDFVLAAAEQNKIWIGYTMMAAGQAYTPRIKRFDAETNKLEHEYAWKDRGALFDMCLESDGSVIASRDVPTSSFTVPVYPFLEQLLPTTKTSKTYYQGDTNWLIDAVSCQDDRILMAESSVARESSSRVSEWWREGDKTGLLKLPSRAYKIYSCATR